MGSLLRVRMCLQEVGSAATSAALATCPSHTPSDIFNHSPFYLLDHSADVVSLKLTCHSIHARLVVPGDTGDVPNRDSRS